MDLAAELTRFGPGVIPAETPLEDARAYCRHLAASHYENFTVASWLVPRHLRQHLCNVYAYCRWADDLADERVDGREPLALLDWWERLLNGVYAGEATHPVFVALKETIREFGLPRQPFADLLAAFRRDQEQTRYETRADLLTYCEKSANPVGRIVLHLGRCSDDENVRLSDSICTGLQLANFWQDVKRDYEKGRIYIPQKECRLQGWDESRFAAEKFDPAFQQLLRPLVDEADRLLAEGLPLIGRVSADLRVAVRLFIGGGQAVLSGIRRSGYDVWSRRPTVGRFTRLRLLAAALLTRTH
jgi:squalene synthase HpnC